MTLETAEEETSNGADSTYAKVVSVLRVIHPYQ